MNPPKRTIRPYVNHSLDIHNLNTYQDFLRKRPKKTQQFKFSTPPQDGSSLTFIDEKQIQLKLLKALKLTKPLIKVDLKDFIITGWYFWKAGILSAWKRTSHARSLSVTLMNPEAKSVKRYFKYLPRLNFLDFQLNDPSTIDNYPQNQVLQMEPPENYLQYVKYSPKIHSLRIQDSSINIHPFIKTSCESKRYFRSVHHLSLESQSWGFVEHSVPIEFCENLESISLQLSNSSSWLGLPRVLNALPTLSHLKEIYLSGGFSQMFNLANAFREIGKKGILEKFSLELNCFGKQNFYEILEPLKLCKLKHFSLLGEVQAGLFMFLSNFIKSMSNSLESFEFTTLLNSNDNDFLEMCKQINKLQKLKNLKLNLGHCQELPNSPRTQCFIPYLSDVFKKPIKMEIFHLRSNRTPPAEALQSLISVLGTSTPFLTHLKIDIGTLPNIKKTCRSLLPLLKNPSRIEVLEIPGLGVTSSTSQLFIDIARALRECIYLRVFKIGEIKPTVALPDFLNALEIIWSKKGLRQFDCVIRNCLQNRIFEGAHVYFPNMKRVMEKNPQLDTKSLANNFNWLIYRNDQWIVNFFSHFGYNPF